MPANGRWDLIRRLKVKFNIFLHIPYRPDLAPLNNHMFGPKKETLYG